MEEKESKKHIKYTTDPVEHDLDPIRVEEAFRQFVVEIVEEQDRIIMKNIHHIGGKEYEHITIDRDKTIEALDKATAKKPTVMTVSKAPGKLRYRYRCSACNSSCFSKIDKYCHECGQKYDWSGVK